MNINRFNSPDELFQFTADYFFEKAEKRIVQKGSFNTAISGGSTPLPFFRILSERKDTIRNWSQVNFFWVDERWVPLSSTENNYGEAMRAGLENLQGANFYPFNTTLESPEIACDEYSKKMTAITEQGVDLILLGAGTDGHTASIFDHDLKQVLEKRIAFVTQHPQTKQVRLSLTMTSIKKSKEALIILLGEEKRSLLKSILNIEEPKSPIQQAVSGLLNLTIVTDIHG